MSEKLTCAQRRKLQKLEARVEKATNADRLFFERHPDRTHRLRCAYTAEIESEAVVQGEPVIAQPGYRILVVVKCLCRGSRLRMLLQGLESEDTDISEAEAAWIYEMLQTPQTRAVEARMRAISCSGESVP
jgi:hypothetical protein